MADSTTQRYILYLNIMLKSCNLWEEVTTKLKFTQRKYIFCSSLVLLEGEGLILCCTLLIKLPKFTIIAKIINNWRSCLLQFHCSVSVLLTLFSVYMVQ